MFSLNSSSVVPSGILLFSNTKSSTSSSTTAAANEKLSTGVSASLFDHNRCYIADTTRPVDVQNVIYKVNDDIHKKLHQPIKSKL